MCGILGYIGTQNGTDFLLKGLSLLEYRGYDSVGIGFFQHAKSKLYKTTGSVTKFKQNYGSQFQNLQIFAGLGHTRWATHGAPTAINAHPHVSYSDRFIIIHNGIVENYLELKDFLDQQNIKQKSQTDTEIFVNYLDASLANDNLQNPHTLCDILDKIRGSFAVVLLDKKNEDKLFLFRKKSPLIIGRDTQKNIFAASDMNALAGFINEVALIPDNAFITASKDGQIQCIQFASKKTLPLKFEPVTLQTNTLSLEGYDHFMLKEIEEQPFILKALAKEYYDPKNNTIVDRLFKPETLLQFQKIHKVCLIGCGTSFHAAKFGEYVFDQINNLSVFSESGGEFKYRNIQVDPKTLYIFLSQSGETADLIGPAETIKHAGGFSLAICNVINSTLSQITSDVCYMKAGPEISVASTKSFTAQMLLLIIVAQKIAQIKGLSIPHFQDFISHINTIDTTTDLIFKNKSQYINIAKNHLLNKNVILFIGRNINYPIALEGALKLKEISYKNCDGMQMGELKHGPLALIDANAITLACESQHHIYDKYISNIREVLSRNGTIISIVPDNFEPLKEDNIINIFYPNKHYLVNSLSNVFIFQQLAYYTALCLNLDIDKPRNLAKSVTVE